MSSIKKIALSMAVAGTATLAISAASAATIVIGNGAEPASIDPGKIEGQPGGMVAYQLFEGLTSLNAEGEVVPGAAESWSATENNTVWTFELRDGLKWSNGEDVTAADFEYAWKRVVSPELASPYSWYMSKAAQIKNAQAAIDGDVDPSELAVTAVDEDTLRVELKQSVPYFPSVAAHYTMYPVPQAVIEEHGDMWTRPGNMVSNGAYKLEAWTLNEKMDLVRNAGYWNNANVELDGVTFLPIEDENSELARFEAGEIHVTATVPNAQIPRLKREFADEFTIYPNLAVYYYEFNTEVAPFDDKRVRKALSLAIDREVIVRAVTKGGQTPAYTFVPTFVAGFEAPTVAESSLNQIERDRMAIALLEDAGFNKDNPLEVDFLYNTSEGHRSIAVAISQMWKQKLGVKMNLQNQEWKTFLETKKSGGFDVARAGWGGDYNEASTFLDLLTTGHGNNDSNFSNAEFDRLMEEAAKAEDANVYYTQAEAVIAEEAPLAPIYYYTRTRMINQDVQGWPVGNAQDVVYVKDLSLQ